jgi:CHAD domain-containing protein
MSRRYRARWYLSDSLTANARRELPLMAAAYFADVRLTLAANPPLPEMHRLRLGAKRLRYGLELFRALYGPGLDGRLKSLRKIQRLLGELNDAVTAAALLPRAAVSRNKLLERANESLRQFRAYWELEFAPPERERAWVAYLAKPSAPG